ncbi:MAG: FAD-linked oxidase C-terminal domain-containing protein [Alphaproteobacteria bacterium]
MRRSRRARLRRIWRILAFGHAGDGNIHYTVMQPPGPPNPAFQALCPKLAEIVQDVAVSMNGSISAEHGIGVTRREELPRYKDQVTLDVMAKVKAALDPKRIMKSTRLDLTISSRCAVQKTARRESRAAGRTAPPQSRSPLPSGAELLCAM